MCPTKCWMDKAIGHYRLTHAHGCLNAAERECLASVPALSAT
jgi:hypothetical protein